MKIFKNVWITCKSDFLQLTRKQRAFVCVAIPLLGLSTGFLLQGCSTFGRNPSPPTKLEQALFQPVTNYVPVVVPSYVTNQVTVTQTNVQGVTSYLTNIVPVTVPAATNLQQQISLTPGAGEKGATTAVTVGAGLFGYGGIASTAMALFFGAWRWLRSAKSVATAGNSMQIVEVMREFIKSLPNGAAFDNQLTKFMADHQAEAGVTQDVLSLLENAVSNPDAKVAAANVIATLQSLGINPTVAATPPKV